MDIKTAKSILLDEFILNATGATGKLRNGCLWYCSPYRNENSPSFKLTRDKLAWYDHGVGEGGNIIDLALRMSKSDEVKDALGYIENVMGSGYIIQTPIVEFKPMTDPVEPYYSLISSDEFEVFDRFRQLTPHAKYMSGRGLDLEAIAPYLENVKFNVKTDAKKGVYNGVGMANISGGYETRANLFGTGYKKTTVGEKDISVFQAKDSSYNAQDWHRKPWFAFYSMMDFLTFITLDKPPMGAYNFTVIHGDGLASKAIEYLSKIEPCTLIHYPHNDHNGNGQRAMFDIMAALPTWKHGDRMYSYEPYKDLNEWHMDKADILYRPASGYSRPAPKRSPKLKP